MSTGLGICRGARIFGVGRGFSGSTFGVGRCGGVERGGCKVRFRQKLLFYFEKCLLTEFRLEEI